MTTTTELPALSLTGTESETLAQVMRDDRKAERAALYEPAAVSVMEWDSVRQQNRQLEDRLDRTLRQLGRTVRKLQETQDELDRVRRGDFEKTRP
jgi:hypothetical protein